MKDGYIEQVGTPMEVYAKPASVFVAGFIGSPAMNLFDAAYLRDQGAMPDGLPAGTDLVGVRPDDLLLAAPDAPHMTLQGTVALLEPAGAESHIYVSLAGNSQTTTVRVPGLPTVTEGQAITLYAGLEGLHPFNSASGKRVG